MEIASYTEKMINFTWSSGFDQRSHKLNYNLSRLLMKILMTLYMRLLMALQVWIKNLHMKASQVLMILESWIVNQKWALIRTQILSIHKSNNMKAINKCVNWKGSRLLCWSEHMKMKQYLHQYKCWGLY